jgi:hypothetical protein
MKINIYLSVLLFSLPVFLFQNCSKGGFTLTNDAQFRSDCEQDPTISEDCYNREQEFFDKQLGQVTNPTDILFVLDNSISMEVIANSIRDGFNSITSGQYPPDTKMAVTYMSPAKVNDDDTIDYTNVHPVLNAETAGLIINSPGYMNFVSKDGLDNYRTLLPTLLDKTGAFNFNISIAEFTVLYPDIDYKDPQYGIAVTTDGLRLQLKYNPAFPMTDIKRNTNPTSVEARKKLFAYKVSKPGCSETWFSPTAVDTSGATCLSAAVQLAPIGTGIEAGIVTLEQFLKKSSGESKKLFRDNAKVNIVLVSDTHESGYEDAALSTDRYFGTPGARKTRPVLGDLQAAIQQNNSLVSSFKVHGIVPMPERGNPLLEGLNYDPNGIPTDPLQSFVSGEGLNGFAYLPFIRSTGGLAVHAASSNWSQVAQSIVAEAKYTGNVVVTTKHTFKRLLKVSVNDVDYDLNKIVVSTDRKSFSIRLDDSSVSQVKIAVTYERQI